MFKEGKNMTINPKKYLTNIAIGIRFGPSFSLLDNAGKIIDLVLYTEGSFFDKKVFPEVFNIGPYEYRLGNSKTGDYLTLTNQDLILNCNFESERGEDENLKPKLKVGSLKQINSSFQNLLEKFRRFEFDRIKRLGYINKYIINDPSLSHSVTNKIIGDTIDGVSDLVLRFSKKYPLPDALVKKAIYDYHNVIYTLTKKPDIDDLYITLDYQEFYEPTLESTGDLHFQEFLTKMETYNNNTFPTWFDKLGEKVLA